VTSEPNTEYTQYTFQLQEGGQRLDQALTELLPDLSRSQVKKLITDGHVFVEGQVPVKAGVRMRGGEHIEVHLPPPAPARAQPEAIPLKIIYEDGDVVVVDKAAGMVVHPSAGHATGTLVNAVLAHAPDLEGVGGELRPGIVHRLDKDTSGVIVVAKNDRALRQLQAQFQQRRVVKHYTALLVGRPPTPNGRIEAPIGRDPANRKRMAVVTSKSAGGREAFSEYSTLETLTDYTLVDVHPITGRTHQVRVHMAMISCPLAGDRLYANQRSSSKDLSGLRRHFLHASRLMLQLPDGIEKTFVSPLPRDLQVVLKTLRKL